MPLLPLFYRIAAGLMVLNALLHLLVFIPAGGLSLTAQLLVPAGFVYLLLAWGLWQQSRWIAWVQFFVALIGGLIAFAFKPMLALPDIWVWAIIVLDVDVAILMLLILWPSRKRSS